MFELSAPVEGGGTTRDHLEQVEAVSGLRIPELHPTPPLSEVAHLWGYFAEVSRRRGNNGFGPNPLQPGIIIDWQKLRGIRLTPWEIDALLAIDDTFMADAMKRLSKDEGTPQ
jgi:hypothetical protein